MVGIALYSSHDHRFHSTIYKIPVGMTHHGLYPGSTFHNPQQIPIPRLWVWVFPRYGCRYAWQYPRVYPCKSLVLFALGGVVSNESAVKASSLMNAFGSFGGGEFRQGDGVNIHSIGVGGGLGDERIGGESLSPFKDTHLLSMENFCLFNPGSNGGWDGSHGEDHGGELLVESKRELVNEGDFVSDPQ